MKPIIKEDLVTGEIITRESEEQITEKSKGEEKIQAFAGRLSLILSFIDDTFIENKENEKLLDEALTSLRNKINYNENALALIMALGGNYDGELDSAKCSEIEAIKQLIRARRQVREITIRNINDGNSNKEMLKTAFGLG